MSFSAAGSEAQILMGITGGWYVFEGPCKIKTFHESYQLHSVGTHWAPEVL